LMIGISVLRSMTMLCRASIASAVKRERVKRQG
jgi:hypothetical protein